MNRIIFCVWIIITLQATKTVSQTLPLGYPILENYLRRSQLTDDLDSTISFTVKPLHLNAHSDSLLEKCQSLLGKIILSNSTNSCQLKVLPIQFNTEFNSHHPYGWNNGSLIRARGIQGLFSPGLFARLGPLTVQLRPEFMWAQNLEFNGFPDEHSNEVWRARYRFTWNRIDSPEHYGSQNQTNILPGQSSIRLNYKGFSLGVSTENLWWGPGQNHSLIMTNNARGFQHITFNTIRPIKTPIGTFEGQMIVGKLENLSYNSPEPERVINSAWSREKKEEWRYINGLTITYSPKWIPGLFLGASRVTQNYNDSTKIKNDYLPVFTNLFRENDQDTQQDGSKDQILSFFIRWVWPAAKAEIYAEVGRSDASWNFRDLLMSPEHSMAYMFGFKKMIELSRRDQFIEIGFEVVHLELSKTGTLRAEPTWYLNGRARQGYTHRGEILGTGIGPGSNLQSLRLSWVKKLKSIGIQVERLVNDNDFYYRAFGANDDGQNWVDLSFGINGSWCWDRIVLDGEIQFVTSKNYQWESGMQVRNIHSSIRLAYLFK
ncbi:MAG: hypothetical protein JXR07_08455 [Reichenbachiella sp.]